ncbi:hypothetical protein HNR02_001510 [Amycolatopsis endophytica]|uniref:Uncharacterized protein n=1 Tax=Amycolatopsis endophytica TaxID=860233 RepID=A0A853AZZ3_9PSEU|nr:hypothetical protein [Amycolatopsis endophytica]
MSPPRSASLEDLVVRHLAALRPVRVADVQA